MTSSYECRIVLNDTQALSKDIFGKMIDNNDGTYSYTFEVQNTGFISISIIQVKNGLSLEYTTLRPNASDIESQTTRRDQLVQNLTILEDLRDSRYFYIQSYLAHF